MNERNEGSLTLQKREEHKKQCVICLGGERETMSESGDQGAHKEARVGSNGFEEGDETSGRTKEFPARKGMHNEWRKKKNGKHMLSIARMQL